MKNLIKLVPYLVLVTLSLSGAVYAKEKTPELVEKKVNAKCYVQLVGGGETISLWLVKPSLLNKLASTIIGKKTLLIAGNAKVSNKSKSIIYKAMQCVLEEDEFSSARARALDEKLPR